MTQSYIPEEVLREHLARYDEAVEWLGHAPGRADRMQLVQQAAAALAKGVRIALSRNPSPHEGAESEGADRDSIRFAKQFADQFRSGAQGAELDADAAMSLALALDDILAARPILPVEPVMVTEAAREWAMARAAFVALGAHDVRTSNEAKSALERLSNAEDALSRAALNPPKTVEQGEGR